MALRKTHQSWFIGWLCLGIIVGIAISAGYESRVFLNELLLAAVIVFAILCVVLKWRILLTLVFICGMLLGICRASPLIFGLKNYQPYYNQQVKLTGYVSQDPSVGEGGTLKITLSKVVIDDKTLTGNAWISTRDFDIKRGDKITVTGKLTPGFGNMAATIYRANINDVIRPNPGDIARRFRDWFGEGTRRAIPEPQVSLGLGYLVGQKTALPKELEEEIKIVGLTHAVVASGYNLTILVVFSRTLFLRISKYMATICSSLMVLAFMCVTGFSPSMSRAGLVACLGLVVWYYGRKSHPFVLLSFAAAITALINPAYVWGDLGWYLSFGSFIGVIVLAPLLHHYFWGKTQPSTVRSLMIETTSAQIMTLPIIQYAFGLYSVYALPANMMVLPLVPLAMLFTFIAGIAGLVLPTFANIIGLPAFWSLAYSTKMISWWANLPNSQIELKFNLEIMIASYIVLCTLIIFLIRRTSHDFRSKD